MAHAAQVSFFRLWQIRRFLGCHHWTGPTLRSWHGPLQKQSLSKTVECCTLEYKVVGCTGCCFAGLVCFPSKDLEEEQRRFMLAIANQACSSTHQNQTPHTQDLLHDAFKALIRPSCGSWLLLQQATCLGRSRDSDPSCAVTENVLFSHLCA